MILFLDIDGVLVTGRANVLGKKPFKDWLPDMDAVAALNYLLSKLDNPKVVISSTWRYAGKKKMQEYMDEWGVKCDVIGITPICKMTRQRSMEINLWIEDNKYDGDYIVIDDDNFDLLAIPPEKFLHVEGGWEKEGLTKELVDNYFQGRQTDDA